MRALEAPPRLRVSVAGQVLSGIAGSAVAAVRVQTRLGLPAQCVVDLDLDLARSAPEAVPPAPGDALCVEVVDQAVPLFVGAVTGVEHCFGPDRSRLQRVHAYDALHQLRQRQQVRVLEGLTVRGLVEVLCDDTDLLVDGPEGPALPRVHQHRRSDLEVLRDATQRCGLYPVVDGGLLRLVGLCGDGEPVELSWGASLHSAQVEVSTGRGLRSVRVDRWDAATVGSGSAWADDASTRTETAAAWTTDDPGGGREQLLVDRLAPDDVLAATWAQAELDRAVAGTVVADLVADGDVRLRAGARVRLRDLGGPVDGVHVLTEAPHDVDADGWVVHASTRPPAPPAPHDLPGPAVTLGTVTDVEDPERRGRVRVRAEAYGGLETSWVPVVTPGAGPGRGLLATPDVGDAVALLLVAADLDQALVLGGLHRSRGPRDDGVADGRVRRSTWSTAEGELVALDDEHGALRLENPNGSVVELGREQLRVTAATDLLIEAPGHVLTLRARAVRFEEAP